MATNPHSPGTIAVPLSVAGGSHVIPAMQWGPSQDLAFSASGGAVTSAGPFATVLLRIAILSNSNARLMIGGAPVTAIPSGTLLIGPEIEFAACPLGAFVSAISNDGNSGFVNITPAL